MLNTKYTLILTIIVALTTLFIRLLPFLIFPDNKETPKYVLYLGKVLPFTIIGMLIVYCLKDVVFYQSPFGLPEILAVFAVVGLHLWKKNTLLSIGAGTVIYMFLVQTIFK